MFFYSYLKYLIYNDELFVLYKHSFAKVKNKIWGGG